MQTTISLSRKLKDWIYIFAIAFIGTALLYNPDSMQINFFWFFTFLGVATFAFEPIPNAISAILLMLFYIVFEVAAPKVVFSPWLNFVPWQIAGGLCICRTVQKTGFAQRIALNIIKYVGKTPSTLFLSFLACGYVLNLIIPSGVTNTIILSTFALGICQALDFEPNSKGASSIMLATYFGAMTSAMTYLPSSLSIVGLSMLTEQGYELNVVEYTVQVFTLVAFSALSGLGIIYFYSRKDISSKMEVARAHASAELEKRGKMQRNEKVAIGLFATGVFCYFTQSYHGLPGVYLMVLIVFLAFVPPFNLLEAEDVGKLSIPALFFIVGCMSIGMTASHLGLPTWMADKLVPVITTFENQASVNVFTYFVSVIANFVMTPVAAAVSLTLPLADIAAELSLSVQPMLYSMFLGLDQWIFPYEIAPALFIYATGYVGMRHILIIMTLRTLLAGVGVWLNSIFIWPLLGL